MDKRESGIWLVGAGNMGRAMLQGWTAADLDIRDSLVIDPSLPSLPDGLRAVATPPPDAPPPRVAIIAVKPQIWDSVAAALAPSLGPDTVIVSVMAGVTAASLEDAFGIRHVARVMPNLPVAVLQGVMAAYAPPGHDRERAIVTELFEPLGMVEWFDREDVLHAATAIAGCGPAFVFRFIDALGEAAIDLGLPDAQARRIAVAMTQGALTSASGSTGDLAAQADAVASKGGATRAGLDVLDNDDALKALIARTLQASYRRSKELSEAVPLE